MRTWCVLRNAQLPIRAVRQPRGGFRFTLVTSQDDIANKPDSPDEVACDGFAIAGS